MIHHISCITQLSSIFIFLQFNLNIWAQRTIGSSVLLILILSMHLNKQTNNHCGAYLCPISTLLCFVMPNSILFYRNYKPCNLCELSWTQLFIEILFLFCLNPVIVVFYRKSSFTKNIFVEVTFSCKYYQNYLYRNVACIKIF